MTEKTQAEVLIDGKILTVGGYESDEYLQRVASYINNKIQTFKKSESFNRANNDTKQLLIELNIASDYFKAKKQIESLEADAKVKQDELYNMKHDMINKDMAIDSSKQKIAELEKQLQEYGKRIVQLETENKDLKQKTKI